MRLADLVSAERAVVPLEAETLAAAASALLDRLVAAGAVSDVVKLSQRIAEDRPEDIVAMGDRAFLLHYRTDAVRDLVAAVGTSRTPICRQLGDGETQCARIVLMVVAPPGLASRYLQVVGAFARFLSSPEHVAELLAQPTAGALASLPALRLYELPEQLTVGDLMLDRPRTISPDAPLRDAGRALARSGLGELPVVDEGGRVIGMLTEQELMRDMLANYLQGGPAPKRAPVPAGTQRSVRDIMIRQVLCVSPDLPLAEAASTMINKDVGGVPVVREGRLVGFLTRGDIVRKLIGS
jgi:CBS domain-containing protein/mannitol/fructose-specific phosphotransferase system IIA component (Ntr-type)